MRSLLLALTLTSAFAQPKIENAKVETRPANGALESTFRTLVAAQTGSAWIGYQVAQISGERSMCGTVSLEGAPEFIMLFRVTAGHVEKIRTYATDCTFDAGGLNVFWLTGADGEQSGRLLSSFIPVNETNRTPTVMAGTGEKEIRQLSNSAMSALGRHRDGAPVMIELARRSDMNRQTRQEVMRWLGRSQDPRAIKFFQEILASR